MNIRTRKRLVRLGDSIAMILIATSSCRMNLEIKTLRKEIRELKQEFHECPAGEWVVPEIVPLIPMPAPCPPVRKEAIT